MLNRLGWTTLGRRGWVTRLNWLGRKKKKRNNRERRLNKSRWTGTICLSNTSSWRKETPARGNWTSFYGRISFFGEWIRSLKRTLVKKVSRLDICWKLIIIRNFICHLFLMEKNCKLFSITFKKICQFFSKFARSLQKINYISNLCHREEILRQYNTS